MANGPSASSRVRGFEVADASVRHVIAAAVLVAAGVSLSLLVVRLMMLGPENAPAAFGSTGPLASFTHGPREKTSIQQSWDALQRDLAVTLGGYGWIDREHGIVRIPIERAMELVAQEPPEGTP
jgi:hypothetical protein